MDGIVNHETTPNHAYRYNGKELDEVSQTYEYGFRYYDPTIGKFIGVDPIADQFAWVSPFNYAENKPVSGVDLHGLQYLDHNVKFKIDNSSLNISGRLEINVKYLNLTKTPIGRGVLDFHKKKSSKTFDTTNKLTFNSFINFNPQTGERIDKQLRIEADLNIDFTFEEITNINQIERGDFVLGLVDEITGSSHGKNTLGITTYSGVAYLIEIDAFNRKTNADTHEKGHMFGALEDMEGKDAPFNFLMSYNNDGSGFKLKFNERKDIIIDNIYQMGLNARGQGRKNIDSKSKFKNLLNDHSKH